MNATQQLAALGLLSLAATGCRHKTPQPLAQTQAPSIKKTDTTPPPAGNPLSTQGPPPLPNLPPDTEDASKHAPPPPKPHHRRKPKPADTTQTADNSGAAPAIPGVGANPSAAGPPNAAATAAPPAAAAPATQESPPPASDTPSIGQLSTGDVATSAQTERDTVELITSTENGLNNIKRTLSSSEKDTAVQIRSFLQKAKAALEVHDVDGAHTLATKAKVLLKELTTP